MNTLSKADRRYLDRLAVALRLRDVSGEQTGEILAEAEAHVAATGESLSDAFGPPRSYARQWGRDARRGWLRTVPTGLGAGVGSYALAAGALALGRGDTGPLGLPAGWTAALGAVIVLATAALLPYDPLRDPRTGITSPRSRGRVLLVVAVAVTGVAVLLFVFGLADR